MSERQDRPLVTFALIAYNQERFVREAVKAALSQEYAKLEIILSDDSSTDSTFEIINSVASDYSGFHEIVINRNPVNLGLAKHFSKVVTRARGEIIVVAAGDDISLPTRVSKTVEMLCADPEASFVSFTDIVIDEDGKERWRPKGEDFNKTRKIKLEDYISGCAPHLSGASRGFRKKVFDFFGDLLDTCPTEDTPYILRGLMIGHALISSECGILYRQHEKNLSGAVSLHSMKIEAIKKQYIQDAEFALSAGLITEHSMFQINNWAEKNYRRRVLSREFYRTPTKGKFFLHKIIPSNDMIFREKYDIFRSFFRRK